MLCSRCGEAIAAASKFCSHCGVPLSWRCRSCGHQNPPGGRFCVSDLCVEQDELPPEVATQPAAWAGCIAGALVESDYLAKIEAAGFVDVTSDATEYPGGQGIASANVQAARPVA